MISRVIYERVSTRFNVPTWCVTFKQIWCLLDYTISEIRLFDVGSSWGLMHSCGIPWSRFTFHHKIWNRYGGINRRCTVHGRETRRRTADNEAVPMFKCSFVLVTFELNGSSSSLRPNPSVISNCRECCYNIRQAVSLQHVNCFVANAWMTYLCALKCMCTAYCTNDMPAAAIMHYNCMLRLDRSHLF